MKNLIPDFALGFEENGLNICQDKACEQKNRRRIQCNTPRTLLRTKRSYGKDLETFYRNPNANSGIREFKKGITVENPTFGLVLGLCPTLAVSTSLANAIGMGVAATFVLLGSNIIISLVRKIIPSQIRIPCFIVIIATFVTINELMMKAYFPVLDKSLGIFVPLIVVNCIVLGRAEAFACKRPVLDSIFDALGMGVGFTLALVIIAAIRESLGTGKILGISFIQGFEPVAMMILAPGALLTLGLLIGIVNYQHIKIKKKLTENRV